MAAEDVTQVRPHRVASAPAPGASTPATSASQLPRRRPSDVLLNRYRIMDTRGTGGFGTVLACWDTRLQRRVAIKRLPIAQVGSTHDSASTLRDALAEARTSSMLSHPNIVTVFDFEVEGPVAYLVMEYVDGITLSELLSRVEGGALTCDECAYLVHSIGRALAYAHGQGVLHLDIKPTNIMLDTSGTVKLCDFGMATLASAAGYAGARGGTIGYMPPEQIEGDYVDERSDIFSLAVVSWQALAGKAPFAMARTAEQSLALESKGAPSLSKLGVEIPEEAEAILLGALDPAPTRRPSSVADFAEHLATQLGDVRVGAQSVRHLLSQADDPYEEELELYDGERLPLAVRYPWLEGASARLLCASLTLACAWPLALSFGEGYAQQERLAAAIAAGLAAAWPPLGSLVIAGATCARMVWTQVELTPVLVAICAGALALLWWVCVAIRSRWSTATVLLPACMGSPLAGMALSACTLRPAAATCTTLCGYLTGIAWPALRQAGFLTPAALSAMAQALLHVSAAISLGGCLCGAAVASAISHARPSVLCAVLGQVCGCAVLVGSQLLAGRMENGGIWPQPTWDSVGIGVVLCVAMCIACACHGPSEEQPEGVEI